KNPSLLLERGGPQTVRLGWSLRGDPRPEGVRFDLRWPACPAAVLDLYLPAHAGLTAPEDVVVSGPHEEPLLGQRWRLYCGGRDRVGLTVHPARRAGPPLRLVTRQLTTQVVGADAVEAR